MNISRINTTDDVEERNQTAISFVVALFGEEDRILNFHIRFLLHFSLQCLLD